MVARLLTVEQAAAELHETVTVATIRGAIRSGRLAATKIGRRYYVTDRDLEAFICRAAESLPVSTSEKMNGSGSSVTEPARCGRDMALASVERLKRRSGATSQAASLPPGEVLPIRTR